MEPDWEKIINSLKEKRPREIYIETDKLPSNDVQERIWNLRYYVSRQTMGELLLTKVLYLK